MYHDIVYNLACVVISPRKLVELLLITLTRDEDGMPTIGLVEPFQIGIDNWDQYTERLELYFTANSITEGDKK